MNDAIIIFVSKNGNDIKLAGFDFDDYDEFDPKTTEKEPLATVGCAYRIAENISFDCIIININGNFTEDLEIDTGGIILDGSGSISGKVEIVQGDLTLRGDVELKQGGVVVNEDTVFIMEGGSVQDSENNSGVTVKSGAQFIMKDGRITNNGNGAGRIGYGGGVYIEDGAEFIMEGGEISNNSAKYGGAVWVEGMFKKTGGEISGNCGRDGEIDGEGEIIDETGSEIDEVAFSSNLKARSKPVEKEDDDEDEGEYDFLSTRETVYAHLRKKDYDKALETINSVIEPIEELQMEPDDPDNYYIRAEIYEAMSEYEKAIADCKKALKLDPKIESAKKILKRCQKAVKSAPVKKESAAKKPAPAPKAPPPKPPKPAKKPTAKKPLAKKTEDKKPTAKKPETKKTTATKKLTAKKPVTAETKKPAAKKTETKKAKKPAAKKPMVKNPKKSQTNSGR